MMEILKLAGASAVLQTPFFLLLYDYISKCAEKTDGGQAGPMVTVVPTCLRSALLQKGKKIQPLLFGRHLVHNDTKTLLSLQHCETDDTVTSLVVVDKVSNTDLWLPPQVCHSLFKVLQVQHFWIFW